MTGLDWTGLDMLCLQFLFVSVNGSSIERRC